MNSNRRTFLKTSMIMTAGVTTVTNSSFGIITGQQQKDYVGHGDFKYKVDKEWGIQDPTKFPVKDCHEMVQDSKGRLILLTNHTQNNVLIYDRSGKITGSWGKDFPGAHGLTLWDAGGEEFLFITDQDRHQVYKTTMDGKVLMTLDYPKETGVYENADQYKPTETAIGPNGDIYVADGYGENYITQYNSKGEYIRHFGGTGEGQDQFDCCHGVTLDERDPNNPTLLITSRTRQEFKRFNLEGKHIETIPLPGCWICRPVIKGDNLYFAVIVTETWDSYDGMVAVLDKSNKVVSFPGGESPKYNNGILVNGKSDFKTLFNPHDICVDNDENLYIPQWNSDKTYPVRLERI